MILDEGILVVDGFQQGRPVLPDPTEDEVLELVEVLEFRDEVHLQGERAIERTERAVEREQRESRERAERAVERAPAQVRTCADNEKLQSEQQFYKGLSALR